MLYQCSILSCNHTLIITLFPMRLFSGQSFCMRSFPLQSLPLQLLSCPCRRSPCTLQSFLLPLQSLPPTLAVVPPCPCGHFLPCGCSDFTPMQKGWPKFLAENFQRELSVAMRQPSVMMSKRMLMLKCHVLSIFATLIIEWNSMT